MNRKATLILFELALVLIGYLLTKKLYRYHDYDAFAFSVVALYLIALIYPLIQLKAGDTVFVQRVILFVVAFSGGILEITLTEAHSNDRIVILSAFGVWIFFGVGIFTFVSSHAKTRLKETYLKLNVGRRLILISLAFLLCIVASVPLVSISGPVAGLYSAIEARTIAGESSVNAKQFLDVDLPKQVDALEVLLQSKNKSNVGFELQDWELDFQDLSTRCACNITFYPMSSLNVDYADLDSSNYQYRKGIAVFNNGGSPISLPKSEVVQSLITPIELGKTLKKYDVYSMDFIGSRRVITFNEKDMWILDASFPVDRWFGSGTENTRLWRFLLLDEQDAISSHRYLNRKNIEELNDFGFAKIYGDKNDAYERQVLIPFHSSVFGNHKTALLYNFRVTAISKDMEYLSILLFMFLWVGFFVVVSKRCLIKVDPKLVFN